ncbi:MAG: hypothetical protein QOD92_477 [Acidimicrobiaceae bacterium]
MTWHADNDLLVAYSAGRLDNSRSASIEAHVVTCASCRDALAELGESERLESVWAAIETRVDEPTSSLLERTLRRLGVSEGMARLISITPLLRLPWVSAVAVVLALTVLASYSEMDEKAVYVFLVAAPLLPLLGIALSFGRSDPVRELTMATPVRKLDLLLARATTVLLMTTAINGLAALALGREDWSVVTWLLPALGLTAGALALSTWVPTHWAAGGLAALWVSSAIVSARGSALHADLMDRFVAFRPEGQVLFVVVAVAGCIVIALRRDALEIERFA